MRAKVQQPQLTAQVKVLFDGWISRPLVRSVRGLLSPVVSR